MRVDATESVVLFSFRLVFFSMASLVIFSSPSFSCLWRRQRQLLRSAAISSQLSGSISKALISFAHVLVPQLWAATGSFANGKFSIEDVLRYSAILNILRTWPIQRILRCLSSVYMVGRPARSRTSVLGSLSDTDDAAEASQVETI